MAILFLVGYLIGLQINNSIEQGHAAKDPVQISQPAALVSQENQDENSN
jgi:hypothetical protein